MTLTVYLSAALICLGQTCYPALVGEKTPVGVFSLNQRMVLDPMYRGSVVQFNETDTSVQSIHRPWLGKPSEKRLERLASTNPKHRVITAGCINVEDAVYEKVLKALPSSLHIKP